MVHRAGLLLLPALLLCGCFNPDYSGGYFLCEVGGCPEGYGCVRDGKKKICKEGVPDDPPETDGGVKDHGSDGPVGDGFMPKNEALKCSTATKEFSDSLRPNAVTWDLTLDEKDNPYLVLVDDMKAVWVHYIADVVGWSRHKALNQVDGPVAATIDGQLNLHIAHKSGSRVATTYAFLDSIKDGLWSTVDLYNKNEVVALDIGASPRGTSVPWYVLQAKGGSAHHLVEGRMTFSNKAYGAGKPCERIPSAIEHPVVSVAYDDSQNIEWAATSFFGALSTTDDKGWKLTRYAAGTAGTCPTPRLMDCPCAAKPGRLALHIDGDSHVALSRSASNRGALQYIRWNGADVFKDETVVKEPVVDPGSVDIDVDAKGRPCISFFADGLAGRVMLRVACLKDTSGKDWRFSGPIEGVPRTNYTKMETMRANSTRVAIGKGKGPLQIHVAYTVAKKLTNKVTLKYLTCALP